MGRAAALRSHTPRQRARPPPRRSPRSTSLGEVVKGYLAKRAAAEADGTADEEAEMLIMPGSQETRIAADLISKLGSENSMVPNAVPIYQVDGLTELEGGQGEGKPQPLLCFFRFNDMQARVEKARKAKGGDEKNATAPDAKLRVRLMRLHEVAALAGSERLPGACAATTRAAHPASRGRRARNPGTLLPITSRQAPVRAVVDRGGRARAHPRRGGLTEQEQWEPRGLERRRQVRLRLTVQDHSVGCAIALPLASRVTVPSCLLPPLSLATPRAH